MGVMQCSRRGCDNILCDRCSINYGYICYECFEELVNSGMSTDIEDFMNTMKKYKFKDTEHTARQRYEQEFPIG